MRAINYIPVPSDGDKSRASTFLAVSWALLVASMMFLGARFFVRIRLRIVGLDDYLMASAGILHIVFTSLMTVAFTEGAGGRHLYYLEKQQIVVYAKYLFVAEPFSSVSGAIGKCSVGFLILRITGPVSSWRNWFIHLNIAVFGVIVVVALMVEIAQCSPVRAFWDISATAKCRNSIIAMNLNLLQSAYGTFMDFSLALLPITIMWKMNMTLKRKICVCILLSLGVFAGIGTAIKTAKASRWRSWSDKTWDMFSIHIWAAVELDTIIICGCAPTLKPLYDRIFKGRPLRPQGAPNYIPQSKQIQPRPHLFEGSHLDGKFGYSTNEVQATDSANSYAYPRCDTLDIPLQIDLEVELSDSDSAEVIAERAMV